MMWGLRYVDLGWCWGWEGFPVEEDLLVEGDMEALRMLYWDDVGLGRTYDIGLGKMQDKGYLIRDMV